MDLNSFVPLWENEHKKALRTWDFEEKWQAFHTPNGRLMSCAHRGDRNQIYPENSLEAFYSAVLAGADILEADIRVTRDGVPVVMHDPTLTRTTNLAVLRAAGEDWMPRSGDVADWTAAELSRLRVIFPDGTPTDCHIPTLEQLILLAKDRCFITLDKAGGFSFEDVVLPLIEKYHARRTVLVPYEYRFERVLAIQQAIKAKWGEGAPYFAKATDNGKMDVERTEKGMRFVQEGGLAPILRSGEFDPKNETFNAFLRERVKGKYRFYAESLHAGHDNEENWRQMADAGCNILMGNRNYDLIDFVRRYNGET
ncbi:MAG: glycerophosphodiester phosphodiesterase family protein [Clostridia bacterium]|nr:glycerophosphodiester phosphodiesterase family protein [Clostridia bacterium]